MLLNREQCWSSCAACMAVRDDCSAGLNDTFGGLEASGGPILKYVTDKSRSLPKLSMWRFANCAKICKLCLSQRSGSWWQESNSSFKSAWLFSGEAIFIFYFWSTFSAILAAEGLRSHWKNDSCCSISRHANISSFGSATQFYLLHHWSWKIFSVRVYGERNFGLFWDHILPS